LVIKNSTFSGNSSTSGGAVQNKSGTLSLANTIVANSLSGWNCYGPIMNGGNNIDSGVTCGWVNGSAGSMTSTDPVLGQLADNGGPTWTFALLAGSPAIDGITYNKPNHAPLTDQRGVSRPQGAGYDIGSYEAQVFSIFLPLVRR
jgi:predicted outer membrane repeat protein